MFGKFGQSRISSPTPSPEGGDTAVFGGVGGSGPQSHPARLSPSTHGSAMSAPSDKLEVTEKNGLHQHRRRRWLWTAIALALLAIIALALGLGLGLGLRRGSGSSNSGPPPPVPTCTGNCTYQGTTLSVKTPWQIVLSETLNLDDQSTISDAAAAATMTPLVTPNPTSEPNVTLYDIDMFLHQNLTVVQDLRAQGIDVICYFSSGSYEPNRPDSWKFNQNDLGNELDGWPGEYWLDLNSNNVRQIMSNRIKIAASMNCTGIDPDNVDGYDNDNGLGLTQADSVSFMRFLAQEAGQLGLMTGLKNAGDIIDDVIDYVQFSVNEQCAQYDECDDFSAFPDAGKPVFHIEYPAGTDDTDTTSFDTNTVSKYCNVDVSSGADGFNTVLKYMNVSTWVQYCNDKTYVTSGFVPSD